MKIGPFCFCHSAASEVLAALVGPVDSEWLLGSLHSVVGAEAGVFVFCCSAPKASEHGPRAARPTAQLARAIPLLRALPTNGCCPTTRGGRARSRFPSRAQGLRAGMRRL